MKLKFVFFSLIFSSFLSCTNFKQKTRSEIYSENTIELLNQMLEKEDYQICDCILEPSENSMLYDWKDDAPVFDFKKYIVEKLELKDISEIDSLYGIREKLILDIDLISDRIYIVPRKKLDSIRKLEDIIAFREFLSKLYIEHPNMCYLSKPIFDSKFEKGLFDLTDYNGHMITPPPKIKKVQGNWDFDWN
ncbi:hypothetical protein [Marinirhabdus gelatinilytica]|nr:hypothetical protein [Marinirhabdus gelatinilytica]